MRDVANTINKKGNNGAPRMLKLSVSILSIFSFVMMMFWSTGSIDNNDGRHLTTTMNRELSELEEQSMDPKTTNIHMHLQKEGE
jgi:hypothetical protein